MGHLNLIFNPPFQQNMDFPSKTPMYSTIVQRPVSNRGEIRASLNPYPLWKIKYVLQYARGSEQEPGSVYQYVLGFFMNVGGQFSDFLYLDPNDNHVDQSPFAVGDGSTQTFQTTRTIGVGTDIVQNLNGTPTIFTPAYDFPSFANPLASQNFMRWSQEQNQSVWLKTLMTVSGSPVPAPDGGSSAWTMTPTGGSTDSYFAQVCNPPTITNGGEYTFSIWLKAASPITGFKMFLQNQAGTIRATGIFNLTTSWDRYTVTGTFAPGDVSANVQIGGAGSWTAAAGSVDVAWAQLELGPTALAYITFAAGDAYFYTISNTGIVQFSAPPPNGAALVWTGDYYYRIRFGEDETTFDQDFDQIWNNGNLNFISVIL